MKSTFDQPRRAQTMASSVVVIALSVLGCAAQANMSRSVDALTGLLTPHLQLALRAWSEPTFATNHIMKRCHLTLTLKEDPQLQPLKLVAQASAEALTASGAHALSADVPTNFVNLTTSPRGPSRTSMEILSRIEQTDHSENVSSNVIHSDFQMERHRFDDAAKFLTSAPSARWGFGDAKVTPDPVLGRNRGSAVFTIKF